MFGIDDAIAAVSNLAKDVVDRVWPDATEVEKAKMAQVTAQMQNETNLVLAQLKINEAEASSNWFAASWRPFIGWTCGFALAYSSIIEPLARFVAKVCFDYAGSFPVIDTTITMQILFGMLGLGAMRTIDKRR